jgi:L-fuconolactonase
VTPRPRIVDSHTHYIEPPTDARPYALQSAMHPLSFDEIASQAAAAGVDQVVQVTASTMGDDNRYSFEGHAARPDRVLGVVGRFDPVAPKVRERLAAYRAQRGALGIRLTLFHDFSAGWLRDRALDECLRAAADLDVAVCLFAPGQTAALRETLERHPRTRVIVDHMNIRHEPNAWIKVSYFPEAAMGSEAYPYPTAQRRFRELYEAVGAGRLVWGSNYPVVARACTWREALDFVRVECDFLAAQDRDAILGGNFLGHFA